MYKYILPVFGFVFTLLACVADSDGSLPGSVPSSTFTPIDGQPLAADRWENDNFVLQLEEGIAAIQVIDKSNGFIWSSRPRLPKYENMSADWRLFAESLLVLDFINPSGNMARAMYNPETADSPVYVALENGFAVSLHFHAAQMRIGVEVRLTDSGISICVPDEHIEYLGSNIISRIIVMPFFGATYQNEVPGYIFLPDGSGTLMRFAPSRPYGSSFISRIYGEDRAFTTISPPVTGSGLRISPVPMPQVYFPVFGVVHDRNAFFAVIESGDVYCELEASPAGDRTDYFWTGPQFLYHELYWQPTGRNRGFVTAAPDRNLVNAQIDYHFLNGEDANYAGMANVYRQNLIDKGWLVRQNAYARPSLTEDPLPDSQGSNIPIKLDVIMAEPRQALVGTKTLAMTQTADVSRWMGDLKEKGLENITFSLLGAEHGGINGHTTGSFRIENSIGGESGFRRLFDETQLADMHLTLQTDFMTGYEHQIPIHRAVHTIGGTFLAVQESRPLFSTRRFMNMESVTRIVHQLDSQPFYMQNLSLDAIGNTLTSDFNSRQKLQRDDAREQILEILKKLRQTTNTLLLEAPNAYAMTFGSAVYNVPVTSSRQIFLQDVVPFYQMVLSGYVDLFSPYLNYMAYSATDMLTLIDFNLFPSYVLTEAASNNFARTNINDIYSSRFLDWSPLITEQYEMVNNVLAQVRGQSIVARHEAAPGVMVTRYSGGGSIVVNYSDEPFSYQGVLVEAESARFISGS